MATTCQGQNLLFIGKQPFWRTDIFGLIIGRNHPYSFNGCPDKFFQNNIVPINQTFIFFKKTIRLENFSKNGILQMKCKA
jgi:hypothetical protein